MVTTRRFLLAAGLAGSLVLLGARARADVDASATDADATGVAQDDDASAGDDEGSSSLQPTVFDSNLGCDMAGGPDSSPAILFPASGLGLFAIVFAIRRRRP